MENYDLLLTMQMIMTSKSVFLNWMIFLNREDWETSADIFVFKTGRWKYNWHLVGRD